MVNVNDVFRQVRHPPDPSTEDKAADADCEAPAANVSLAFHAKLTAQAELSWKPHQILTYYSGFMVDYRW